MSEGGYGEEEGSIPLLAPCKRESSALNGRGEGRKGSCNKKGIETRRAIERRWGRNVRLGSALKVGRELHHREGLSVQVTVDEVGKVTHPFQTLVKPISRSSASRLDVPSPLSQRVETKFVGNLGSVHGIGKILFVGENEEERITKFIFVEHTLEFLTRFGYTLAIVRVDYEDDTLGVLEVCR